MKGTKNIPNIKSTKKRILIPTVRNKDVEAEKTRQDIANVFAKFYEICTKERKNMKTKKWNQISNKKTRNSARAKQSQSSLRKKYRRPSIV